MPARKAPIGNDSPALYAIKAAPKTSRSVPSRNSSGERVRATHATYRKRTRRASKAMTRKRATARPARNPAARGAPVRPLRASTRMRNGKAARSWKSSTPSARRPCWVFSSCWSESCFAAIAVDDIAIAPPTTAPASQSKPPTRQAATAASRVVATTCKPPIPNTTPRAAIIRGSENSSPTMNMRSATPNSPRMRTVSVAGKRLRPCGPMRRPAAR